MSTTPRIPVGDEGTGMFSGSEGLGRSFMRLYGMFWREGVLDHEVKEAVRIRNARITDCGY